MTDEPSQSDIDALLGANVDEMFEAAKRVEAAEHAYVRAGLERMEAQGQKPEVGDIKRLMDEYWAPKEGS